MTLREPIGALESVTCLNRPARYLSTIYNHFNFVSFKSVALVAVIINQRAVRSSLILLFKTLLFSLLLYCRGQYRGFALYEPLVGAFLFDDYCVLRSLLITFSQVNVMFWLMSVLRGRLSTCCLGAGLVFQPPAVESALRSRLSTCC